MAGVFKQQEDGASAEEGPRRLKQEARSERKGGRAQDPGLAGHDQEFGLDFKKREARGKVLSREMSWPDEYFKRMELAYEWRIDGVWGGQDRSREAGSEMLPFPHHGQF